MTGIELSSPTGQSFYPSTTLNNLNRPSPSPTKRTYSSPNTSPNPNPTTSLESVSLHSNSNNLGSKKIISRIKLTEVDVNVLSSIQKNPSDLLEVMIPTVEGNKLNGLAMSLSDSQDSLIPGFEGGMNREERSAHSTTTSSSFIKAAAESQTRRLYDMPLEFSTALSKLCSQHRSSQYNTLKRVAADAANSPPPLPPTNFLSNPPMPPIRPMITRSQSTPSSLSQDTNTLAPILPSALAPPPLPSTSSLPLTRQPSPSESTPSTPPPGTTSPVLLQVETVALVLGSSTSLTPTLASMTGLGGRGRGGGSEESSPSLLATRTLLPSVQGVEAALREVASCTLIAPVVIEGEGRGSNVPAVLRMNLLPGMKIINGIAVKTSTSHPMNITAIIPLEFLPLLASHIFKSTLQLSSSSLSPSVPFLLSSPSMSFDLWDISSQPTSFTPLIDALPSFLSTNPTTTPSSSTPPATIGNFYLSSCPGKKVRLDSIAIAQAKLTGGGGRGAICRSVRIDLERAKSAGVRLIICCLDDEELAYLGSPWEEYIHHANELELTVMRIPMIEGFAPSSPKLLDEMLNIVIKDFSLKGSSVLAHCRGGIGRAGLVSCCWMIKMGLVLVELGEEVEEERLERGERRGLGEEMRVVERVIEIIRRRRSIKSIETPQQVHFLLDYVHYLKNQAQIVQACEL